MLEATTLNKQQKQAVTHQFGPMLVVAGAGTGKTQVITYRVAHLLSKKLAKASEILAVTFTEKAAKEMETRVGELLGTFVFDVNITTFNAFGYHILQRFCFDIGLSHNLKLLTQTQQLVFLRQHLDELGLNHYSPITNPEGMLADIAKFFSKLKNELIEPEEYIKFAQKLKQSARDSAAKAEAKQQVELAQAYGAYQQLSRANNVIDFDDQVYLAVALFEKRPHILKKIQHEIRYILVDEFQDTNTAQSRLIDLLAGQHQNVMVVGDDDQSIYKFRGAAVANILQFKDRYPEAKQLALLENYRSGQAILDSAYRLIQYNNPDRLEARYGLNKRLVSRFRGSKPRLKTFLTYEDETQWIARDIKRQIKQGQVASEIAVLLRRNDQARILEKYLQTENLPYVIIGETKDLYRQAEVKLLLSFLRVVCDPKDSQSLYHLLVSDVYGIKPSWLREQVAVAERQHQTLEKTLSEHDTKGRDKQIHLVAGFFDQLERWREVLPKLSVGKLCYRFLEDTKYLHKLMKQAQDDPAIDAQIANLNQYFMNLLEYERVASDDSAVGYLSNLPTLLGTGERLEVEDLPDVYGQKVRLLTMHKAKGLEFTTVYLFDQTQDSFPARRQPEPLEVPDQLLPKDTGLEDVHLQEERRLMYVAMTRAKKNLILTCSVDHGGRSPKRPSIFIEEALGVRPELKTLLPARAHTNQIELFKPAKRIHKRPELPPTLIQGKRLVLTTKQIEDYLMCPAEFRLRHILAPPQPPLFALEYGSLIHSLIQLYNRLQRDKQPAKLSQLQSYLKQNWPKEGFISQAHSRRSLKQAQATLKRYFEREQKAKRHPRFIEQSFELELPELKLVVHGRFDAVYEDRQGIEIRDYKSGASGVTTQERADKRANENLQLGIYALAWLRLHKERPDIVSLDFVDSGLTGTAHKTDRQLESLLKKIAAATTGIRKGDFSPSGSHIFCSHQEYGF